MRDFIVIFIVKLIIQTSVGDRINFYERSVIFTVFNNLTDESYVMAADKYIADYECDPNGKFAFVIHGWEESIKSLWVKDTIRNLTFHRGGCVIFMDYSRFSNNPDYFLLTPHFFNLAELLARKIRITTSNYDNVFVFGFSFGARLAFEAGTRIGYQMIDQIHACEPAGPAFDIHFRSVDPKKAAKYVYCINTSVDKGTSIYNCHINFRMGVCGRHQIGASRKKPYRSHGLCPFYYNSAFEHDFVQDNFYNCSSQRLATEIPSDFKMGYMENRRSQSYYGDVFIPTLKNSPWNVNVKKLRENYTADELLSN